MKFVRFLAIVLFAGFELTGPAFAGDDYVDPACEKMWFSRNFIMHQAGYCFGSNLGKAVFSNAECTGKNPSLSSKQKRDVADIKNAENSFSCKVDTSRISFRSKGVLLRAKLVDQPVRSDFESACINYLGADEINLYAGRSENSAIVGVIKRGLNINWSHEAVGQWDFLEVGPSGPGSADDELFVGWSKREIDMNQCELAAG